jgi:hypothetical protein
VLYTGIAHLLNCYVCAVFPSTSFYLNRALCVCMRVWLWVKDRQRGKWLEVNHQQDAIQLRNFYYSTYFNSSACFERYVAHHQEPQLRKVFCVSGSVHLNGTQAPIVRACGLWNKRERERVPVWKIRLIKREAFRLPTGMTQGWKTFYLFANTFLYLERTSSGLLRLVLGAPNCVLTFRSYIPLSSSGFGTVNFFV